MITIKPIIKTMITKTTTVMGIIVRNENVIIRITIRILNLINQNIRIKMMHIYKVLLRKQC
jgi:hypothetical protein